MTPILHAELTSLRAGCDVSTIRTDPVHAELTVASRQEQVLKHLAKSNYETFLQDLLLLHQYSAAALASAVERCNLSVATA